jgi:PPOX class probable F420-dependent enzyme
VNPASLLDAFLLRARHPQAWGVASLAAARPDLTSLRGHKHCLLVTFRRNGEPVPTPVWFALAADSLYIRTAPTAGKLKRIRRNPDVLVAPCTVRGRPLGAPIEARARVLDPSGAHKAERALQLEYGLGRALYERVLEPPGSLYLEVRPKPR